jgi:hypothetical protein
MFSHPSTTYLQGCVDATLLNVVIVAIMYRSNTGITLTSAGWEVSGRCDGVC